MGIDAEPASAGSGYLLLVLTFAAAVHSALGAQGE